MSLIASWYMGGATPVRLYNLYCRSHDSEMARRETSAIVGSALADAESRGAVTPLICGDLNQHLGQLDMVPQLAASGW
eukprot:16444182-Heterocapsa_arctica.AAC.1